MKNLNKYTPVLWIALVFSAWLFTPLFITWFSNLYGCGCPQPIIFDSNQFNVISALFTGVGTVVLIWTLKVQQDEFKRSNDRFEKSAKIQRDEFERANNRFERSLILNQIQRDAILLSNLIDNLSLPTHNQNAQKGLAGINKVNEKMKSVDMLSSGIDMLNNNYNSKLYKSLEPIIFAKNDFIYLIGRFERFIVRYTKLIQQSEIELKVKSELLTEIKYSIPEEFIEMIELFIERVKLIKDNPQTAGNLISRIERSGLEKIFRELQSEYFRIGD